MDTGAVHLHPSDVIQQVAAAANLRCSKCHHRWETSHDGWRHPDCLEEELVGEAIALAEDRQRTIPYGRLYTN